MYGNFLMYNPSMPRAGWGGPPQARQAPPVNMMWRGAQQTPPMARNAPQRPSGGRGQPFWGRDNITQRFGGYAPSQPVGVARRPTGRNVGRSRNFLNRMY